MGISKRCNIKAVLFGMVIIIIVLSIVLTPVLIRPDIHTVTIDQLEDIQGIGTHKADLILSYLESNKEAEISDLDCINGIGEVLVERIEKVYR